MILVTVGTHEQQFDRLLRAVDSLKEKKIVDESVFIQTGYSTYAPKCCNHRQFVSYAQMKRYMSDADVVITHGGPSSFIEAIAAGKVPVVVPRRHDFGEHVNNHQVEFVRFIEERRGDIVPVYDTAELSAAIDRARELSHGVGFASHNAAFCDELRRLIEEINA